MFHWDQYTILRILLSYLLGIILYLYFEVSLPLSVVILLVASAFLFYFLFNKRYKNAFQLIIGVYLNIAIFATGNFIAAKYDLSNHSLFFVAKDYKSELIKIKLTKPLVEKEKTYKTEAEIIAVLKNNTYTKVKGKAMVYFNKNENSFIYEPGDEILVVNKFNSIKSPLNPGAFDYKTYAARQNIDYNIFLKQEDVFALDLNLTDEKSNFMLTIFNIRSDLVEHLKANLSENSFTIAAALLLGQKDYLQAETKEIFSDTGTMHILAVSGLHVGILFMIFSFLLQPLAKYKVSNILRVLLIIILLWIYAAITGFSPSVVRACIMLSFYEIGNLILKNKNNFIIVYATALAILVFNPYLITHVGFQLSFAAVLSILFFYPKIYSLLTLNNRLFDYFYKVYAITIAAQIGTLAITIFYFKQFSVYFILSNLIAVPFASLIFINGFTFFALSILHQQIATYAALSLDYVIWTLNLLLKFLDDLPFSNLQFSNQHFLVPLLTFAFIITFAFWLNNFKRSFFRYSLILLILIVGFVSFQKITSLHQKKIIVFHNKEEVVINCLNGKHSFSNTDIDSLSENFVNYSLIGSNAYFKAENYLNQNSIHTHKNYYEIANKSFFVLEDADLKAIPENFEIDFLILSKNPFINFDVLIAKLNFKKLIIAADNSYRSTNFYQQKCEMLKLDYYNIKEKGALVIDLL